MKPCTYTDAVYETRKGHWPFVLTKDLIVHLGMGFKGIHKFIDKGVVMATLVNDTLAIHAGYASDGASPHICTIGPIRIGTPSHKRIAPGFFAHDCMYQFGSLPCCPWTYAQADDVLYHLMRERGSILGAPYHAAVSIFGGLHRRFTSKGSTTIACIVNHALVLLASILLTGCGGTFTLSPGGSLSYTTPRIIKPSGK